MMQQVTPAKLSIKSFFALSTPSPAGSSRAEPSISAHKEPAVREVAPVDGPLAAGKRPLLFPRSNSNDDKRAKDKGVDVDLSIEVERVEVVQTDAIAAVARTVVPVESLPAPEPEAMLVESTETVVEVIEAASVDEEQDESPSNDPTGDAMEVDLISGTNDFVETLIRAGSSSEEAGGEKKRQKRTRKPKEPAADGEAPKKAPRRTSKAASARVAVAPAVVVDSAEPTEALPPVIEVEVESPSAVAVDLTDDEPTASPSAASDATVAVESSIPAAAAAAKPVAKRAKVSKPEVVLPPAIAARVEELKAQASGFIEELNALETSMSKAESDINMNYEAVESDLIAALKSQLIAPSAASQQPDAPSEGAMDIASPSSSMTVCDQLSRFVCCLTQGSRLRLSDLAVAVVQKLHNVLISTAENIVGETSDASLVSAKASEIANALLVAFPDNKFARVCNECLLVEDAAKSALISFKAEVVSWAIREAYGHRAKDAIAFENEDSLSMWAWYVTKPTVVYSAQEQAVVKECIATRSRFGRAVKAIMKVAEQLQATPDLENANVLSAQERASKAILEVEKAKQKRQEAERKRLSELGKAQQKEDQKLAKQKEKEEAAARKKEEAAAEAAAAAERKRLAEEAAAQEKKLHDEALQKKLDKQRNLMQAFLQAAPKPPASSDSASSSSSSGVIAAVDAKKSDATPSAPQLNSRFDVTAFEKVVFSGPISLSEIRRDHISRGDASKVRQKKRRSVTISVSVSVPSQDAFATENYSEIKDITLDGKKKLFAFHDYSHTEYWGTFSKKSKLVTGRRPLVKDTSLRNYDVDSAEEWEDEDAGEDIVDSGDEDEGSEANEPDELVFDEFFRHDDDFGSDAENENMGSAPTATIKRPSSLVKSSAGPRFVNTAPVLHQTPGGSAPAASEIVFSAYRADGEGPMVVCDESEKDVAKLLPFFAVIYPPVSVPETSAPVTSAATTAAVASQSPTASTSEGVEEGGAEGGNTAQVEKAPRKMNDVEMKAFITLVHGQKQGIDKIVETFKASFPDLSKNFIQKTLQTIAVKERAADGSGSLRWMVRPEVMAEAAVEIAPVVFTPMKKKIRITPTAVAAPSSTSPVSVASMVSDVADPSAVAAEFTVTPVSADAPSVAVAVDAKPKVVDEPVAVSVSADASSAVVAPAPAQTAVEVPKAASASTSSSSSNKSKLPSAPPKGQKQLLSFFKPGGSAAAPAQRVSGGISSPILLTPEKAGRSKEASGEEGGEAALDFDADVFERLVTSPSTTPMANRAAPVTITIDDDLPALDL